MLCVQQRKRIQTFPYGNNIMLRSMARQGLLLEVELHSIVCLRVANDVNIGIGGKILEVDDPRSEAVGDKGCHVAVMD